MAKSFIRIYCPICHSMPYPKQLENAQGKKAEVRIMLMTVGGKTKAEPGEVYAHKGKGKGGHGSITYEDVTDQHPELVEKYKQWFAERVIVFGQTGGYI